MTKVVIPIQTISFYNSIRASGHGIGRSCHTYPNDKLLQQSYIQDFEEVIWQRSDVSLNPNALISQDLEFSQNWFSQMPCFFIVKCRVFIHQIYTTNFIISRLAPPKNFANDSHQTSFRILLRKLLPILKAFQCAKLVIFRKTSKDFANYFFLAKIIHSMDFHPE